MKTATAQVQAPLKNIESKKETNNITYEQATLKYNVIAWLYFPMQYLLIRWLVLGLALTPSITDIYNGFNVQQIINIITDFAAHLTGIFNAEHVFFIAFNILPYGLRLAWQLIPFAAFIYAFYTLIVFICTQISIVKHVISINIDTYVRIYTGPPGSGKSSSADFDDVIMAKKMWAELRWLYINMREHISDYIRDGKTQLVLAWYEVRDSYEYYITHDCVPCLFSNIPMVVNGQNVSILTYEHAAQIKRLPAFTVLHYDEAGSIFRVDSWRDKPLTVSDFYRLLRHYGDFRCTCTEQDPTNVFKDVRRVVGQNLLMIKQTWVNKPLLILLPYKIIKSLMIWRDYSTKKLTSFMAVYNTLLRHIGQRKYKYKEKDSTEQSLKINEGKEGRRIRKKSFYLPTMLNYQYDDRTFKNLYLAQNKSLEENKIFKSLYIENNEENKKNYLKETDPNKKQKAPEEEQEAA